MRSAGELPSAWANGSGMKNLGSLTINGELSYNAEEKGVRQNIT